uniref:Uncharacterized protein n=1 Tax=Vespula pensylvanica TaxID=30213 RepID=A0A834NRQ2_VESPE|nr:hypothetical protein H0235_011266 [Vespula pensylvanica]
MFANARLSPTEDYALIFEIVIDTTGRVSRCLKPTVWTVEQSPVGPQKQLPPRGGTWVGRTCDILKSNMLQVLPGEWLLISRNSQGNCNFVILRARDELICLYFYMKSSRKYMTTAIKCVDVQANW